MQCQSCNAEINPQWKHALDKNICPMCGAHIMEEHVKNLFATLRSTMDGLETYQSQLDDWMLSNHQYIKTNSVNLIKYLPKEELDKLTTVNVMSNKPQRGEKTFVKVKTDTGEEEVEVQSIQSEEKTNSFHERANHGKFKKDNLNTASRTQKLKEAVDKIKAGGTTVMPSDDEDFEQNNDMIDMSSGYDQEYSNEDYINLVEQQTAGPLNSAFAGTQQIDGIPPAVLAMAQKGNTGNNKQQQDLAALQAMVNKSKNMGAGGFSRG